MNVVDESSLARVFVRGKMQIVVYIRLDATRTSPGSLLEIRCTNLGKLFLVGSNHSGCGVFCACL